MVLPPVAVGSTLPLMTTISLKLPGTLLREIEQEAATRGVPKSAIIRDCIEGMLHKGRRRKTPPSCLQLMGDLVGSFRGPRDLSTNRRYLQDAVRADAKRGRTSTR